MGVKGWLFIGAAAVLTVAGWLGIRRKRDLCAEVTEQIIRDVDEKEKEEKIPTVDEMTNDVEKAVRDMDLDNEHDDTE